MATRLYPGTENPRTLEILAGVPFGTYELLEHFKQLVNHLSDDDLARLSDTNDRSYAIYRLRKQHPLLDKMHDFESDGWGRLQAIQLVESAGLSYACGGTRDQVLMTAILKAQRVTLPDGITLDDLEGLHWS